MVRLLFTMFMWVTVARWLYAEAELSAPFLVPVVDSVLEVVQIPTHDNWPDEPFNAALSEARVLMENPEALYSSVERRLSQRSYPEYGFDRF
jgi:hypothetical protein